MQEQAVTAGGLNICSPINAIPGKLIQQTGRKAPRQAAMTIQNEIPSQEAAIRQEAVPEGDGSEMEEALERDAIQRVVRAVVAGATNGVDPVYENLICRTSLLPLKGSP